MKKLIKILCIIILLSVLMTVLSGCNEVVFVTGIELNNIEKTVLMGDSEAIVGNVLPHNASNSKIQWESSDKQVVTVNGGILSAVKIGRATVTATTNEGGYSKSVEIEVVKNQFEVSKTFDKRTKGYGITKFSRINDAIATVDDGDEIFVYKGIYDEIVPITKSIKLMSDDATIRGYMIVGYPKLEKNVSEVLIDGFTIECEDKTSFNETACIYIGNETTELTIRNCRFIGNKEKGIGIRNIESRVSGAVRKPIISNCEFTNLEHGVKLCQYVMKAEINNNIFRNCKFGLLLQGAQQTKINGNKFIDCGVLKVERAENSTSHIIFKQNEIITEAQTVKYPLRDLVCVRDGDFRKSDKIDLRGNIILGKKVENLTDIQLMRLKKLFDVGDENDYSKFIFR